MTQPWQNDVGAMLLETKITLVSFFLSAALLKETKARNLLADGEGKNKR